MPLGTGRKQACKEMTKIKAQIQFLKLAEKAQAIQILKERRITIKETLGKLLFSQVGDRTSKHKACY